MGAGGWRSASAPPLIRWSGPRTTRCRPAGSGAPKSARSVAGLCSLVVLRVAAAQALENPNGLDDVSNHTHPAIGASWPRIVIPRLGLRIVEVIHDSPPELMIDARSVRPLASKRYSCKYVMVESP